MGNVLDYSTYVRYLHTSADREGVKVEFSDEPTPASINAKTKVMTVTRPQVGWTRDQWDQWWYDFEHEIGHACAPWDRWPEMLKEKEVGTDSTLGQLCNMLDDYGSELNRVGEFAGVTRTLLEGRAKMVESTDPMVPQNDTDAAILAALMWDEKKRERWNPYLERANQKHIDALTGKAKDWYEKLCASPLDPSTLRDSYDGYDMACKVLEYLDMDPEEEKKKAKAAYDKQRGEGDGEEGEGEDAAEGKEGDGKEDISESMKKFLSKYRKDAPTPDGRGRHDIHIEYDKTFPVTDEWDIREVREAFCSKDKRQPRHFDIATGTPAFANRVKRLLQVLTLSRKEPNQRRGKLKMGSLYRVANADSRVFSKTVTSLNLDVVVSLAVDYSGSMSGHKIAHAVHAAQLVNSAISKLGIPVEIWGFSDSGDWVDEYRIKEYDERVRDDELVRRMGVAAARGMRNNDDGLSILHAYSRLRVRPEKRKVMVVMSDGSPCSSACHHDDAWLKKVLGDIKREGRVELYGVGILDRNVERFYDHSTVITKGAEIEEKLLEVMKRKVIGE